MEVIDVHTHAWPDAIAARALAGTMRELSPFADGRVSSLLRSMDEWGIDRSICLGVATEPDRVESANRFVGSLDEGRFVGFGSIHPRLKPAENINSLRANRLIGVKLHPIFQKYRLDDPDLLATLEAMEGEFLVIVHVGAGGEDEELVRGCTPALFARLVERFPRLDLIACHFGGYHMLEKAEESVIGLPVYLDTAWPPTLRDVELDRLHTVIESHGIDRVLFGSDWPMASPGAELQTIRDIGLSREHTANVLGGNMHRLLMRYVSKRELAGPTD